ncbi:hypothetical protein [Sphingomonas aurantiaca]|uniref:hypothetical protein n=1 Tax=Sphingomonas aurantiaca TaxID=185949 RepID=UPI00125FEB5B|nr:hypothetical protein [Sphingomonas aurantiaca]
MFFINRLLSWVAGNGYEARTSVDRHGFPGIRVGTGTDGSGAIASQDAWPNSAPARHDAASVWHSGRKVQSAHPLGSAMARHFAQYALAIAAWGKRATESSAAPARPISSQARRLK